MEPIPILKPLGIKDLKLEIKWQQRYYANHHQLNITRKERFSDLLSNFFSSTAFELTRGGVEDTKREAKAKKHKKVRGQGQPFRGQTLSRPRTGMLEAKDTGAGVLQQKRSSKFFSGVIQKKKSCPWLILSKLQKLTKNRLNWFKTFCKNLKICPLLISPARNIKNLQKIDLTGFWIFWQKLRIILLMVS